MALFVATVAWLISATVCADDKKKLHAEGTLSSSPDDDNELSVRIRIVEEINSIELRLTGPSDAYFAVGFGSSVMVDTWAVVVSNDGDDGWFEQTLSNHRAGLQNHDKTFSMAQTQFIPQTHQRMVTLQASLSALRSFHPFNVDDYKIDVIWAIGKDHNFVEHTKYGTQTLLYDIDIVADTNIEQNAPAPLIDLGDLTLSALIVVFGFMILCIVLAVYWVWKFCKYLRHRVDTESVKEKDNTHEKDPLLNHKVNVAANPDFHNQSGSGSTLLSFA